MTTHIQHQICSSLRQLINYWSGNKAVLKKAASPRVLPSVPSKTTNATTAGARLPSGLRQRQREYNISRRLTASEEAINPDGKLTFQVPVFSQCSLPCSHSPTSSSRLIVVINIYYRPSSGPCSKKHHTEF